MRQIKIIMIVGDYPPIISGVGDYVEMLSRAIAAKKYKVSIVTTRLPGIPCYEISHGIEIFRVVRGWIIPDAFRILSYIDKKSFDTIVHINYHCPLTYGRKLMINFLPLIIRMLRPHTRVVVTHHEFTTVSLLWKARIVPMLFAPNGIIFVNSKDYYCLKKWIKIINVKAVIIPITSNIQAVSDDMGNDKRLKTEIGINSNEIVIAFFGGIRREKGLEYLIKAVYQLHSEGLSVKLLVIGGFEYPIEASSQYACCIRKEIEKGENEKWAVLAEAKTPDKVSRLLKIADLAVFPFTNGARENNTSMLAALINKVPVITTRGRYTSTGFETDYGVDTIPAGNYEKLVSRIREYVKKSEMRPYLRYKMLNAKKANYSWEESAEENISFYKYLLGE